AVSSQVPVLIMFFFSSRRRHTRFKCDWSSDVCSSDLVAVYVAHVHRDRRIRGGPQAGPPDDKLVTGMRGGYERVPSKVVSGGKEIGRASCRERVGRRVVGGG